MAIRMNGRTAYSGWISLLGTVLLYGILVFCIQYVEDQKHTHAELVSSIEQSSLEQSGVSRLHGLMSETKDVRASIRGALPTDILAVLDTLDAVDKTAGLNVQTSNPQPIKMGSDASAAGISAVEFVIRADGSFAQLSRLILLLNSLAIPTTISQMDFTHSGTSWNLSVRIRLLTSSSIAL